ncbi:TIGR02281 family clan AA aspartic protease [Bradyrhizobium liaoningense]|uniref:retropepsin-like aspartic protease family protein n=1 Tax=Bradyrhizobium liaoningense TaxID=43992 RepID=UPI001BA61F99|nr:retropepsin-like aspartic protease [Bradyrhizobium liaoningense]MBR0714333.1 retropepsin-like domain-containing protein [Bradyrhizobium liaoningense]
MPRTSAPRGAIRFRISPTRPLLMVEAEVNGQGPFNFVLDTGASFCVITPKTAAAIGLKPAGKKPTAIGAGGRIQASLAKLKNFRLGSHAVRNLGVAIMALDHIEQRLGVEVAGLVGYNFLKAFVVTLDYPNGLLRLKRRAVRMRKPVKR